MVDWSAPALTAGATLLTVIRKVSVALSAGDPSSVTRIVTVWTAGPLVAFQLNTPLPVMLAPAGAPGARLNVRALPGSSGSVALTAKASSWPSSTERLPMVAITGGWLTSRTVTVRVSRSLSGKRPSSVTRTVTAYVPGP